MSQLFTTEELKCEVCQSTDVEKTFSIPLKTKNTMKGDKYHNVNVEPNIRETIMKRSREHSLSTLKDTIDKVGERVAKEKGWVDPKTGKVKTSLDEK